MAAQEFSRDEQHYLEWLRLHPDGLVINTTKSKNPDYMVLHCAWCGKMRRLSKNAAPGGFTEREYIKICSSDRASLQAWVRDHGRPDGTFSSEHDCHK